MSIYFKANKKALDAFNAYLKDNKKVRRKWSAIMREVGADDFSYYPTGMHFVGFKFKTPPGKTDWKPARSGTFLPKKSTKVGKELHKRLAEIKMDMDVWKNLLKHVGYEKAPFISERCGTMHESPAMQLSKDKTCLLVTYNKTAFKHKEFELPKGFKEITFTQYEKLTSK